MNEEEKLFKKDSTRTEIKSKTGSVRENSEYTGEKKDYLEEDRDIV